MHEIGVGFFVGAGVPRGPRVNTFIECGCCGAYHRTDFNGDCREDSERHWDLPDDAVVLCHCGYELEDGECPSADCRDDDSLDDTICAECGHQSNEGDETHYPECSRIGTANEWSGACDPCDPANYWIDDETGERVSAATGERSQHDCPMLDADERLKDECEFEQRQPHEWYCVVHDVMKIAGTTEPIRCDYELVE